MVGCIVVDPAAKISGIVANDQVAKARTAIADQDPTAVATPCRITTQNGEPIQRRIGRGTVAGHHIKRVVGAVP